MCGITCVITNKPPVSLNIYCRIGEYLYPSNDAFYDLQKWLERNFSSHICSKLFAVNYGQVTKLERVKKIRKFPVKKKVNRIFSHIYCRFKVCLFMMVMVVLARLCWGGM